MPSRRSVLKVSAIAGLSSVSGCRVSQALTNQAAVSSAEKTLENAAAASQNQAKSTQTAVAQARYELTAAPARVRLVPDSRPQTKVWAFGAEVPGTPIRVRQGQRVRVDYTNGLAHPSTVHWHGLRVQNPMDGVPYLTQDPVAPGGVFRYEFDALDAGTYWYHPHLGTPEQVGRGLYGSLVVEEAEPPDVDRDVTWVLSDFRLNGQAQIFDDFYSWSDVAFNGRIGNTVTVNGLEHRAEPVRAGERLRLRLINAANARLFSLNFASLRAWLIAEDGHPLRAVRRLSADANIFLGPGQRADIIIDIPVKGAGDIPILDRLNPRRPYRIARLVVDTTRPIARSHRAPPAPLMPNPVAEPSGSPDLRHTLELSGGMMGGVREPWYSRAARRVRQWSGSREADAVWAINGHAHMSHGLDHPFEFTAQRGETVALMFRNRDTRWHPMHLHGHTFRVVSRNGQPWQDSPWRDTVMIAPHEEVVVSFVADNPGAWLIHCHILEHHAGGMGTQFRVV